MVACMPACAAFSRHFLTKYGVLSTIRSRFSTSKEGPSKTSKSSATATTASVDSSGPIGTAPVRTDGRYWSVDYSSMQPRGGDRPPQILPNKRQSRFLQSGDLDVFEDEGSPHRSSVRSEQTAVEAGGPIFEKEDCEPNDIV